jgi:hypothetical protein
VHSINLIIFFATIFFDKNAHKVDTSQYSKSLISNLKKNIEMIYKPLENRYNEMTYRRCGKSGINLPAISSGLWHNFGGGDVFKNFRKIIWKASDYGIPILI